MKLAFLGKDKLRFIDGSVKRSQYTEDLERLWDQCNVIVVTWVMCNVSKDLLGEILFGSNTHLIWKDYLRG